MDERRAAEIVAPRVRLYHDIPMALYRINSGRLHLEGSPERFMWDLLCRAEESKAQFWSVSDDSKLHLYRVINYDNIMHKLEKYGLMHQAYQL